MTSLKWQIEHHIVLAPSFEAVCADKQIAHRPHRSEAAPWECALEAVTKDFEGRDCAHRCNATLWKRSFEAVLVDKE
eukprot:1236890-Amphidinium_carterae.1